jgi:exosortase C (VPDSG-CTERM-specific)
VDALALQMGSLIAMVVAGLCWFRGGAYVRRHAFALAFLAFVIPMPTAVEEGLEIFFQSASAEAAYWMFQLSRTTLLRSGRTFELPGLTIEVAQECSGIRSSYVLFMVSLLAGHILLRSHWRRSMLAVLVIPLGILRNGFRILTISLLTIHVDPQVIHGPLHHRGGPVFFALSLVPFFALVWWMRRGERGGGRRKTEDGRQRAA